MKIIKHVTAIMLLATFVVLALGSATGPKVGPGEASRLYFSANGGNGTAPGSQTIEKGESFSIPNGTGLSFGDATFGGWALYSENGTETIYKPGDSYTPPGGEFTFYAKWVLDVPDLESARGLANKLIWLQNNAQSNGNYTIQLNSNESIGNQYIVYPGKRNITITIRGSGNQTINLSQGSSYIFSIPSGVNLIIENVTLQGSSGTTPVNSVVHVRGSFTMNNGATVTGSGATGVTVYSGGTFTMNGGTISRNRGCGVIVQQGTFLMNGGTISENFASGSGGGVNLSGGTFNMSGGNITRNTAGDKDGGNGGGVAVWSGTFTMTGGSITGNTATGNDPRLNINGVYRSGMGVFRHNGGTVQPD